MNMCVHSIRWQVVCDPFRPETGHRSLGRRQQSDPGPDAESAERHGRGVPGQRGPPHLTLLRARLERLREIPEV